MSSIISLIILVSTLLPAIISINMIDYGCKINQFQCSNTQCIDWGNLCDGFNDCSDWKDESFCSTHHNTSHLYFVCSDGRRIPVEYQCNGESNCQRGEDEKDCSKLIFRDFKTYRESKKPHEQMSVHNSFRDFNNSAYNFNCSDGTKLSALQLCDGVIDCKDKGDEVGCKIHQCTSREFQCGNKRCIEMANVCNGFDDCGDLSDEAKCVKPQCKKQIEGDFVCGNGQCIKKFAVCDGKRHCFDGSDEMNCPAKDLCPPCYFPCGDSSCLPFTKRCNGKNDCKMGEDEDNCKDFEFPASCKPKTPCNECEYQCHSGECVSVEQVCDKVKHCSDFSDEICPKNIPPQCLKRATKKATAVNNDVTSININIQIDEQTAPNSLHTIILTENNEALYTHLGFTIKFHVTKYDSFWLGAVEYRTSTWYDIAIKPNNFYEIENREFKLGKDSDVNLLLINKHNAKDIYSTNSSVKINYDIEDTTMKINPKYLNKLTEIMEYYNSQLRIDVIFNQDYRKLFNQNPDMIKSKKETDLLKYLYEHVNAHCEVINNLNIKIKDSELHTVIFVTLVPMICSVYALMLCVLQRALKRRTGKNKAKKPKNNDNVVGYYKLNFHEPSLDEKSATVCENEKN